MTAELNKFINQDAGTLLANAPWFAPIAKRFTNFARVVDQLINGKGKVQQI